MAALTRYSNIELLSLPACERLLESEKCGLMKPSMCAGERCPYLQNADSLEIAQNRLRSLDEETQQRISLKYYGGFRPWMETETEHRRKA